jgi:hypothetical protein
MSSTRSIRIALVAAMATLGATVLLAKIDVQVENSPVFDFSTLHTWTMHPTNTGNAVKIISSEDSSAEIKQKFETIVLPIVQDGFVRRGFPKATSAEPDFYVTCYALVTAGQSSQVMGQFLSPVPEWGLPYFAPSTSALTVFPKGSLIVDISSRVKNEVVWRGVAQTDLKWDDTDAKREQIVRDAVKELLKKFPPKPTKK